LIDFLDSLLIVPNDTGAGSTLYHAVLTENVYELKTKPLDSVPSDSTLVLSAHHDILSLLFIKPSPHKAGGEQQSGHVHTGTGAILNERCRSQRS